MREAATARGPPTSRQVRRGPGRSAATRPGPVPRHGAPARRRRTPDRPTGPGSVPRTRCPEWAVPARAPRDRAPGRRPLASSVPVPRAARATPGTTTPRARRRGHIRHPGRDNQEPARPSAGPGSRRRGQADQASGQRWAGAPGSQAAAVGRRRAGWGAGTRCGQAARRAALRAACPVRGQYQAGQHGPGWQGGSQAPRPGQGQAWPPAQQGSGSPGSASRMRASRVPGRPYPDQGRSGYGQAPYAAGQGHGRPGGIGQAGTRPGRVRAGPALRRRGRAGSLRRGPVRRRPAAVRQPPVRAGQYGPASTGSGQYGTGQYGGQQAAGQFGQPPRNTGSWQAAGPDQGQGWAPGAAHPGANQRNTGSWQAAGPARRPGLATRSGPPRREPAKHRLMAGRGPGPGPGMDTRPGTSRR